MKSFVIKSCAFIRPAIIKPLITTSIKCTLMTPANKCFVSVCVCWGGACLTSQCVWVKDVIQKKNNRNDMVTIEDIN